jgi:hypothetical protein
MLERFRSSLGREVRAILLAAGTLMGIDVASDVTVNEIADVQTAKDVAYQHRGAEVPPAPVQRSLSTSIKALTMAVLLVLSPAGGKDRTHGTGLRAPSTESVIQLQQEQKALIDRSFEVPLAWPEIQPEQLEELARALGRNGRELAELLQRNLPSGLDQAVQVRDIHVGITKNRTLYGTAHAEIHGIEAVNALRETIGKTIYDLGVELLREKCHAIQEAYVETNGRETIYDATEKIVQMQLLRRG